MRLKIIPLFHFFHSELSYSSASLQSMGTVQISHFPQAFLQILFQTIHFHFLTSCSLASISCTNSCLHWRLYYLLLVRFFRYGLFACFYSSQYTQNFKNCYLLVVMTDPSSDLSSFTPYTYLRSERGRQVNRKGQIQPHLENGTKSCILSRGGKHGRKKTERQSWERYGNKEKDKESKKFKHN